MEIPPVPGKVERDGGTKVQFARTAYLGARVDPGSVQRYAQDEMKVPISPRRMALGGGLIALGVMAGVGVLLVSIFIVFASLMRIEAPGSGEIELEPGTYTIYWESPMLLKKGRKAPGGSLGVFPKDGGTPVTLNTEVLFPINYNTLDHSGVSIAEFRIDRKGVYQVGISEPNLKQSVPGRISIGRALGILSFVKLAVIPFVLIAGGIGAGLLILLKRPQSP
jgi:hypothetical protein